MNSLRMEALPDPYSLGRRFVITFGISHLAYGETPEECAANFGALLEKLKPRPLLS